MAEVPGITARTLFRSDFYEIKSWNVELQPDSNIDGVNDNLCLVLVKSGNFRFHVARHVYDFHSGFVLIDKPDIEYRVGPSLGVCTIINFTESFSRQAVSLLSGGDGFFRRLGPSSLLRSTPVSDFLHYQILGKTRRAMSLELDLLVMELFKGVFFRFGSDDAGLDVIGRANSYHLGAVEKAKEYLNVNFASDISLYELSYHCCVSPFHFARLFKMHTRYSPNQYLLNIRLKHGEILLKHTELPIREVAKSSGFNSQEYFATAFRQKYKLSPTEFRRGKPLQVPRDMRRRTLSETSTIDTVTTD